MFHISLPHSLPSPLCKISVSTGSAMLPIDRYAILSVLNLDNVASYSILSIHMNRTFSYLFLYHLYTAHTAGQVPIGITLYFLFFTLYRFYTYNRMTLVKCTRLAVYCYSEHERGFSAGNLHFCMNLLID